MKRILAAISFLLFASSFCLAHEKDKKHYVYLQDPNDLTNPYNFYEYQIIKDDYGREVAYLNFYYNVPLSDFPDITRLQRDYLIYSKGEITKVKASKTKENQYEWSGKPTTIADIYKKAGIIIPSMVKKDG